MYSLSMNLHKNQLYLLEQHWESFKIWSAIIRINTQRVKYILTVKSAITNWSFYNHRQSICQYMYVHFCYFSSSHVHSRYDLLVWFEICEL